MLRLFFYAHMFKADLSKQFEYYQWLGINAGFSRVIPACIGLKEVE